MHLRFDVVLCYLKALSKVVVGPAVMLGTGTGVDD